MMICPYCGAENLEGADVCDDCQLSLTDLSIPQPATPVEYGLLKDRVSLLEPRKPLMASLDTPVGDVLNKMMGESIGCVMIVENNQLKGIFSERDALMKLNAEASQFLDRPIGKLMTPDPVTLEANDRIAFALHKMHVGGYRHLPILTNGELTGVISIRDILNYLSERIGVSA